MPARLRERITSLPSTLSVGWRRYEAAARRLGSRYDERPPSRAAIEGVAVLALSGVLSTTMFPEWIGAPSRDWLIYGPRWAILILMVAVATWASYWFFFRLIGRTTAADATRKAALMCLILGGANAAAAITWPLLSRVL